MSPAVFIRAAEEEGVIISLTQHLFSLIADDFSQRKINAPFHLGVNIAAAHLGDSGFTADVMQLRGHSTLPSGLYWKLLSGAWWKIQQWLRRN